MQHNKPVRKLKVGPKRATLINKKTKRRSRKQGGVSHGVFNTIQHYPKARYPPLPREFEFSSKYSTYDIRLANTTPATKVFGLLDFYNQLPSYTASVYQIYKFARINAITLKVEVVCTGTEPVIIAADILPYSQAISTSVDPHFIASRPRAISKITGSSTGMSKATLSKTYQTAECLGQLDYSDSAWQSYSEAISVLPNADNPFLCISVDSVLSTGTWAAEIVYHVTYHMQFFEQQDPSLTETPESYQDRRKNRFVEERKSSLDDSFKSRPSRR
jgi:hypothetical protein